MSSHFLFLFHEVQRILLQDQLTKISIRKSKKEELTINSNRLALICEYSLFDALVLIE